MICNEFISLAHVLPFCHLSEEDFDLALYEQQNGAIRFDLVACRKRTKPSKRTEKENTTES